MDNQAAPRKTRMTRFALPVLAALLLLAAGSLWWLRPAVHEFDVPQGYAGGVDHRADQPVRAHCQAHFDAGQSESGFYRVRGPWFSALPVYCRMEKGRGLTLVLYGARPQLKAWHTGAEIYSASAPQATGAQNYKLSDAAITYLSTKQHAAFRVERLDSGFAWEMQAAAYDHVGPKTESGVNCTVHSLKQESDLVRYQSDAKYRVRTTCTHARRGVKVEWSAGHAGKPYSVFVGTMGTTRTNDFALIDDYAVYDLDGAPKTPYRAGWFKTLSCRLQHGDPVKAFGTLQDLRRTIAYNRCVNSGNTVLARDDKHNLMPAEARVALYIAHQPAQAAQVAEGEAHEAGEE